MKYRECYVRGEKILRDAGIEEAGLDARLLLEEACGTDRNTLLAHGDREVAQAEYDSYVNYIEKRSAHVPLQYITGFQEFMGLRFAVNEHVLIPRQDTETLVEEAMLHLHDGMEILDMCTGSGCILLSLLYYSNGCRGVGADISPGALEIAEKNGQSVFAARREKPEWKFVESNLFQNLDNCGKFDLIVSNPPYIPGSMIPDLMEEVREHEPLRALDGGEDGLVFYRQIAREAKKYLYRGGMLLLEIGWDQAGAVTGLLRTEGYREIEVSRDFSGFDRVVRGIFLEERNV